jgi:thiol-disulfide isomerase/thioredoxin
MPLRLGSPMPELSGATEWLNGEPAQNDLRGSPVLVHFWATSCHICHDNMPTLRKWRDEYGPRGLKLVGIHMPRQEEDMDVAKVREDVKAMDVTEPCAIDNTHAMADAFQNKFMPAYFLFDRDGNLKSRTAGDAGLAMLESALARQFE